MYKPLQVDLGVVRLIRVETAVPDGSALSAKKTSRTLDRYTAPVADHLLAKKLI
jgi:hypothetical protein